MKFVLDASVAIRWVLPDALTGRAVRLREEFQRQSLELFSPDIFLDEVASALTKAERQKTIPVGDAAALYSMVLNTPPIFCSRLPFVSRAIDISSLSRSSYYDCLYVALAESDNCELITANERLIRNLQSRFPFIKALSSMP
jgi:predicted nucleic acid-binding protein